MKWLDDFLSMMEAGINHANNQSDLGIATTIPLDAFEFSETKNFLTARVNIPRDDFGTHTVEVEIARLRVSPLNDDFEDDEITQDGALLTQEQWQIAFYVDGSMVDATGEGYEMQIIAVVQAAVEYFLNMYRPLRIKFHAADHEGYMGKIKVRGSQERVGGRERVYRIFARGLTRKYGYTDFSEGRDFLLVRDDEAQGEVFDPTGAKKGFQLGYFDDDDGYDWSSEMGDDSYDWSSEMGFEGEDEGEANLSFELGEGVEFLRYYDGDFGASGSFEDDCGLGWDHFLQQQTPLYHGSKQKWEGDFIRKRIATKISGDDEWDRYRTDIKKGDYTRGKISGLPLETFFLSPHPTGSFHYMDKKYPSYEQLLATKRLKTYYLAKDLEIWDYRNDDHLEDLVDCAWQQRVGKVAQFYSKSLLRDFLADGQWQNIQLPVMLDCIRYMGFDGYINLEEYVVYTPQGDWGLLPYGVNGLSIGVFHNQALIPENQLYDIYLEICGDQ